MTITVVFCILYTYCGNNPVNLIDQTGMFAEPTPEEAAVIAKHVYLNSSIKLIGGWRFSSMTRPNMINNDTGLKSAVYERTQNGVTEYVYATAGTQDLTDWKNNALQILGLSSQYNDSQDIAVNLKADLEGAELTYVGHSLGGGLAEANSLRTGDKAITFNAAGVSLLTSKTLKKSNTDAYIMVTDPLHILQTKLKLPTAGGNKHFLTPRSVRGIYDGHNMKVMIEVFQKGMPSRHKELAEAMNNDLKRLRTPNNF